VKEKFLTFNVGHLATIIIWLISCAVMWGKFSEKVKQHETQIQKNVLKMEATDHNIEVLMRESIRHSAKLDGEATLSNLDRRVMKLEEVLPKINDQISSINVNIDWIKKNLETIAKDSKLTDN
jgi:hypothetical protein